MESCLYSRFKILIRFCFWDTALHAATPHYTIVAAGTATAVRIVAVVTRLLKLVTKLFLINRTERNFPSNDSQNLYRRK